MITFKLKKISDALFEKYLGIHFKAQGNVPEIFWELSHPPTNPETLVSFSVKEFGNIFEVEMILGNGLKHNVNNVFNPEAATRTILNYRKFIEDFK